MPLDEVIEEVMLLDERLAQVNANYTRAHAALSAQPFTNREDWRAKWVAQNTLEGEAAAAKRLADGAKNHMNARLRALTLTEALAGYCAVLSDVGHPRPAAREHARDTYFYHLTHWSLRERDEAGEYLARSKNRHFLDLGRAERLEAFWKEGLAFLDANPPPRDYTWWNQREIRSSLDMIDTARANIIGNIEWAAAQTETLLEIYRAEVQSESQAATAHATKRRRTV
jgi:hypothetical protein